MHAPAATGDRVVRCCHLCDRTVNATDRFFYNALTKRFPCLRFDPLSPEDVPRFATPLGRTLFLFLAIRRHEIRRFFADRNDTLESWYWEQCPRWTRWICKGKSVFS